MCLSQLRRIPDPTQLGKEVSWVLKDPSPVLSLHGSVSQVLSQEQAYVGPDLSPLETSVDQKV